MCEFCEAYTYNQNGSVATTKDYYNFRNGNQQSYILLTYTYDDLGRVTGMVYTKSGTVIESHNYTYDKNSNIKKEANTNTLNGTNEIREYTYDYMGQLAESVLKAVRTELVEVETGESDEDGNVTTTTQLVTTETVVGTTSYVYDKVGNRTEKTEVDNSSGTAVTKVYNYTYNGLNQLKAETGSNGLTYTYDANGNQTGVSGTMDGTSVNMTYAYTPSGMLETYTSSTGSQTNLYNGEGQRVQKKEGSQVTNYYYQQGSVLYTTDASGNLKSFNLLNVSDAFGTSRKSGSAESYYLFTEDLRGSTINVVDNAGGQVVSYWYDDFGSVIATKNAGYSDFVNEIQYTGAIYDEQTGLLYLNARFYDPRTGRFLTQDTYRGEKDNAGTWHLYAYCANNPINYVDPSGHKWIKIRKTILAFGLDVALTVFAPALAGTFDIWGHAMKLAIKKAAKTQLGRKQLVILWQDWLYKKIPRAIGSVGKYTTAIRSGIRKVAGVLVPNSYATGLSKSISFYTRMLKPKESIAKIIDIALNFVSLGSMIAYFFELGDGHNDSKYVHFYI